ncbi:MAG: fatty acid desaturase [Nannocystaceae bacterium]
MLPMLPMLPMFPKHPADYRTLLWVLVFVPLVAGVQYAEPSLSVYLWPLSLYLGLSCAVIVHIQMHRPIMRGKRANRMLSYWISIVYGYPIFAWLPTHNLNHHKLVNRHGDATITWRHTNRHTFLVAATYFFVSAYHQGFWISRFIKDAKDKSPALHKKIIAQYVTTYTCHLILAGAAVWLHGVGTGLVVYVFAFGAPAMFALWAIMLINYWQHVHTDPWSKRNHSRNFTGWGMNFLLFGNGYHTVHHDKINGHWTDAKTAHDKIANEIDPSLNEANFWWFVFRQYALAPFFPKFGTRQVGRAPFDCPEGERGADAPEAFSLDAESTAALS